VGNNVTIGLAKDGYAELQRMRKAHHVRYGGNLSLRQLANMAVLVGGPQLRKEWKGKKDE